ncbi:hypothetical protein [Parenemella sanctibonifatiensis]|uniref:Uncharacterized protein n=1 Tax=Parenemella sanctibonifatiensis TaxID=2016505 RepID=A0A255EHN3_9ACTN|nr:hypothetical protein [Parenemella sanctibonifatiensis]OYN89135.1 hypothetical protein CGZ91_12825 [Parenemella sanctibonifatiensis]
MAEHENPTSDQPRDGRRAEPVFVQVVARPSIGVEVTTGTAWVGVDRQVGHGSADALFALMPHQYAQAMADPEALWPFMQECWRGDHEDLLLHAPAGGSFRPRRWHPLPFHLLGRRWEGELWWYVAALGLPESAAAVAVARSLTDAVRVTMADGRMVSATVALTGAGAHPRPEALIGGLGLGSDRSEARRILGEPVGPDLYAAGSARVRLEFGPAGLAGLHLTSAPAAPVPTGPLGETLALLGEPEAGPRHRAAESVLGGRRERWMSSSASSRRLLVHERGACLHIGDGRILGLELPAADLADVTGWSQNHDEVRALLGDPVDSYDGDDLHLLPGGEVLVRSAPDDLPGPRIDLVARRRGTSIASRFFRWRSGEVTAFLDVLGRGSDDPLVDHVRGIAGVTVRERGGVVVAVDLDGAGGALPALLDGMPAEPRRSDIRFGAPRQYGRRDDLWDFEQGWIHARSGRHGRIESVTVCLPDELPSRLHVRPWRFGRDSMDAWRVLSS